MEEENKDIQAQEESDFADEAKIEAPKPEGKNVEEFEKQQKELMAKEADEKAKAEIAEYKEKSKEFESTTQVGRKKIVSYAYNDERLEKVESARSTFQKGYDKSQKIKALISFLALFAIIIGWILPATLIKDNTTLTLCITLGVAGLGIAAIAIYSIISKKRNKALIAAYFEEYYKHINDYVFDGLGLEGLMGSVDNKISEDEMKACDLYGKISAVGSRDNITFNYKGTDFALADAAAQKDTGKGLATVFVGKYLRSSNKVAPTSPIVIYFKGNERALPPSVISEMNVLEECDGFTIYGSPEDRKIISRELKVALKNIHTNRLLVDLAISIQAGKTYMGIGYEDDLMVLPMKDPFNPYFVTRYKEDFPKFLEIASILNK